MKLLILGASGGCGRWATRLAASSGHDVVAMVRPGTSFDPPSGVTVERASVFDPEALSRALAGRDAVISCLGAKRVNPRNPWSPLQPPGPVAEASARILVDALPRAGIRRLAAISAAGVGDSFATSNTVIKFLVRRSTVGTMYADLEAMERVLGSSRLDWLAVRPVTLIDGGPSHLKLKVVGRFRLRSVISRGDVARWLLDAVTSDARPVTRTPMIGWW